MKCPLFIIGYVAGGPKALKMRHILESETTDCLAQDCGWWTGHRCAVAALLKELDYISTAIRASRNVI